MTDFLLQIVIGGNATYLTASILAIGVLLMAVLTTVVLNAAYGKRPRPMTVLVLTGSAIAIFLVTLVVQLNMPSVYQTYYHNLYKERYIGAPDDACLVFEQDKQKNPLYVQKTDAEGNPLYVQETNENGDPVFDDEGNPVFVQQTDEDGKPVFDDDGNPVLEPVMVKTKVQYVMLARPIGPERGLAEIHIWLAHPIYHEGSHLCSLPLTQRNMDFMKRAQKAWDDTHGTEAEEEGEKGQGEQGEGQEGQGPQGSPSQGKPDIMVELPSPEDSEGEEGSAGTPDAESQGNDSQDSDGSITIQIPGSDMPSKSY